MTSFPTEEREVPGAENLKALNASLQHEEEVQRHIEQGNLASHERALYILSHGSTGQKISMLQHLDTTMKDCDEKKIVQIVTELNNAMWTQDLELQCAAPAALITILPFLSESSVLLLLGGVRTMLEVRTQEVRKAWNTLALEVVASLSPESIIKEIVPIALKKGDHSEPHDQRVLCCSLIGRLCRRLDRNAIVGTVLNKALALCQDTDTTVRVAMCQQLGEVARAIGLETTKEKITAELFELLIDEERLVSRAAFTCLIDLAEFFDPPYRREHFYPIIKSYISSPPEDVLSLLIEEFGRFLWKIKSDIQGAEDITLFANFFRQCALRNDLEVRRMCAFNLPAVVASLPISVYPTHLSQTTKSLATDSHPPVRRAIAAGLHELFPLLGDRAAYHLKDSLLALLQDNSLEVRNLLMEHLSVMLDVIAQQLKPEDKDGFFASTIPALVSYEKAIRLDWRKLFAFFSSFHKFPSYFSPALLHEKFVPILMSHLKTGAAALKDMCASLVLHFAKSMLPQGMLVVELFSQITTDYAKGKSCHHRCSFVLLFRHSTECFSRGFIKDRLLEHILDLSKDPVGIVRLQLVRVLPEIRRVLKPPIEKELLTKYQSAVQRLSSDEDSFVSEEMRCLQPILEELEKDYARIAALKLGANMPDDIADKQREEREGNIIELAKEQEKVERRQKLREMLKTEREMNSDFMSGSKKPPMKKGGPSTGALMSPSGKIAYKVPTSATATTAKPTGKSTLSHPHRR